MAVQVERYPDLAVAQALARHLGVDAARKQVRGMGMPQVMEANARQCALARKKADPLLYPRLCGRNGKPSGCVITRPDASALA
jgi:hypothetical protein